MALTKTGRPAKTHLPFLRSLLFKHRGEAGRPIRVNQSKSGQNETPRRLPSEPICVICRQIRHALPMPCIRTGHWILSNVLHAEP
jgi:hypothetical protein